MEALLQQLAATQGNWSTTANELKSAVDRARTLTFLLSIAGALLAALASQFTDSTRTYVAIASAVAFAVMSFLSARLLGQDRSLKWLRARSAAEALKHAAYRFTAQAAPYDDAATREQLLKGEIVKIESDVDDLLPERLSGKIGSTPTALLSAVEYQQRRVSGQIEWFERTAQKYRARARRLRRIELFLSLAACIITAVAGVTDKDPIPGVKFDFVALTAVLTTIGGAILAHIEASRYDFVVATYLATARRLRSEPPPATATVPSAEWSAYVARCESILQDENASWLAKFSK
jgi:hypothetical protein